MRRRGWRHMPPRAVVLPVVVAAACLALLVVRPTRLGDHAPSEQQVVQDATSVMEDTALDEELLRAVPEAIRPQVGELISEGLTQVVVEETVVEAAQNALGVYGRRGDCVLYQSGYLDLSGTVWGCVVQGDGWVEVMVVKHVDEGDASEVTTIHMDVKEWERELKELGVEKEGT